MKYLFQNWRAVAHTYYGEQHLLFMGNSQEQVKKSYINPFFNLLTTDEQMAISRISIEKWGGKPTKGNWCIQENAKVPKLQKQSLNEEKVN